MITRSEKVVTRLTQKLVESLDIKINRDKADKHDYVGSIVKKLDNIDLLTDNEKSFVKGCLLLGLSIYNNEKCKIVGQ